MSERPVHPRPRRLADWLNPTGAKKEHSLIDKVYKRKNLEIAWERVHVQHGFEFLGFKIKRGKQLRLPARKIRSQARSSALYAYPKGKSVQRFKDGIRAMTRRRAPLTTEGLIQQVNPLIRGWGQYYKRAHVRKLFHQLDGWIVRRIWSHRFRRWRCCGWKTLPCRKLYREFGLVNLIGLIPSLASPSLKKEVSS